MAKEDVVHACVCLTCPYPVCDAVFSKHVLQWLAFNVGPFSTIICLDIRVGLGWRASPHMSCSMPTAGKGRTSNRNGYTQNAANMVSSHSVSSETTRCVLGP
eukprot:4464636-Amphidinium_carterae.3